MKNYAIISTSIHEHPPVYAEWAKQGTLIVAGDKNTPPELADYLNKIDAIYLSPEEQEDRWPDLSSVIGWNCIQRRNLAVLHAYELGYEVIATVDDDNAPVGSTWLKQHAGNIFRPDTITRYAYLTTADDEWTDIGFLNEPYCRQRGIPVGDRHHLLLPDVPKGLRTVVSTAQVLGDPDCDAITRVINPNIKVQRARSAVVGVLDWTAFNSQATVWHGQWAPLIACVPGVQRYDDILASYIAKWIMMHHQVTVYAGHPCVTQDRNEHDPAVDLKNELWGMGHTSAVIHALSMMPINTDWPLWFAYRNCAHALQGILPTRAYEFMVEWATAWRLIDTYETEWTGT